MGLMKKLTSAIVASSLVFSLVGTAFAAYTPAAGETAGNRMMGLQILKGKYPNDALALKDEITRAELVTVIVRAFGQEANAALLKGAAAYPDTANHWASGNIAMAKALVEKAGGDAIGMPDGSFNPDGKLTPAQAVAFLMKFLGVKADATKTWPNNFLDKAVELNIITAEDKAIVAPMLNDNATRGLVFYLFDRAFYSYDLGAGKTFYTKYVDTTAPVVTLGEVAATTIDSKVTITGKVEGAKEVYVGTKSITVDANGNFSADYELPELKEYAIAVTARDVAGNVTEKAVAVTRTVGNVATIDATDITVAAGAEVEVKAVAKDAKGNAVANATITGESGVGTFAAGKFTAGKVAGTGKLTLKAGEITKEVAVTVTAGALAKVGADKTSVGAGQFVTLTAQDEFGNTITGATFTQASADATVGTTDGKFIATKPGTYPVTVKVGEKSLEYKVGVYSTTLAKYGVVASAANAIANNASEFTVTVSAQDSNGNLIANNASIVAFGSAAVSQFEVKNTAGSFVALNSNDALQTLKDGKLTLTLRTKSGVLGGQVSEIGVNLQGNVNTAGKTTIELVDQVATSVKVSTNDKFVANNGGTENAAFKIEVLDQAGKLMNSGAWAVKATVTGPAYLVDNVADANPAASKDLTFTGGSANTAYVVSKLGESGTVTVTATVEGFAPANASVTATAAQAASKIEITADKTTAVANNIGTVTYTLRITDANGVPVATEPTTVVAKFGLTDTNYAQISTKQYAAADDETLDVTYTAVDSTKKVAINFLDNGTATLKLQATKFVGDLKVTFVDEAASGKLTAGESTISYTADVAAKIGLVRHNTINVPATNPTVSLTAQLFDGAGNVAKVAGKKLTFTGNNDDVKINGGGKTAEVVTDAEGKATVNVSVLGYVGNAYVYDVTVAGTELTAIAAGENDVTIKPANAVANSLELVVLNNLNNQTSVATAGDTLTLKATVKDLAGKVLAGETVTVEVTEGKTVDAVIMSDNGDGTYSGTFQAKTAGRLTLTVKDTSAATEIKAPVSINARAAAQAAVKVERADYTTQAIKTTKGTAKAFRIIPVDTYNNVSAKTDAALTVSLAVTAANIDANKYFEIRSTADGANLAASGTATITIPAGSTGVTFYVLSNDTTGVDVTVTANTGLGDGTLVFTAE